MGGGDVAGFESRWRELVAAACLSRTDLPFEIDRRGVVETTSRVAKLAS
jgi:hypothetical protein